MYRLFEIFKANPLIKLIISMQLGIVLLIVFNPMLTSWLNLKPPARICHLWFIGIIIDVASFLLFAVNHLKYRSEFGVGFPIIGWGLYALACVLCPNPVIFNSRTGELDLVVITLLKVIEFILLTCVHYLFQFFLPRVILVGLKKKL